ncbi:F-box protein [Actinidia chinensis var. chinensis]|uniref:F-box protein n=1 Tax=Actinidia chinensis var. chinensis TaxID=1590841 RepID=A0A2R6QYS9_ACTCC|nr:F-box protein [Actinidia chinensis var. chinensis]
MDLLSLVTSGVRPPALMKIFLELLKVGKKLQEDKTHNPEVPAVSHQRGLIPFVFVPFEEVETSVLNLPVETMDYFVPG